MRILIVSEDQSMIEKTERLLKSKNLETEAVNDGEVGEEYAELGIYDVMLLDEKVSGKACFEIFGRTIAEFRLCL